MCKFPLSQTLKYHLKWKRVYKETFADIPDRKVLHDVILPGLAAKSSVKSLLDIGCEWYNLHHQRVFSKQEYTTIDIEDDRKSFGARQHVTGSVLELDKYFETDKFDLLIANGIIGHGVTKKTDVVEMAKQIAHVIKPGGYVLIGWNDRGNGLPEISPDQVIQEAGFIPSELPGLSTSKYLAYEESQHWFELYQKTA